MKFLSTQNHSFKKDLKTAVFSPLPPDGGLFLPEWIPVLDALFYKQLDSFTFHELAFAISKALLNHSLPDEDLKEIISKSLNFPVCVRDLSDHLHVAELFHGPSLAFKDFGARFMAQLVSYFMTNEDQRLFILVATSGDTGGAVAAGFYKVDNIEVVVLYPNNGVSLIQEKQMTTLGNNVHALKINGSFDDCQKIVKEAFLDSDLNQRYNLSSANSINIARLMPQIFYYFEIYKQLMAKHKSLIFSVPSGNFGNLTAGLIAKKMGLPIKHFIAATNANDTIPRYLNTGEYKINSTKSTLSNAMDVSDPSNFQRIQDLYGFTWNNIKHDVSAYSFDDTATLSGIKELNSAYKYISDPHTAIAYLGLKRYFNNSIKSGVFLSTAHPIKFKDIVETEIGQKIEIPNRLLSILEKEMKNEEMEGKYASFKEWMLKRFT